ncbi:MAG TPA: ATP-binding cassette domain-containing protein [Candidatus Acidoferrales bacterium]|nr:ATP-binding cassette domain-containing protein [Candidatus Acidoferrales bacterium]
MSALIEVEHLSKQFGGVRALDDVTLTIQAGEWVAIMGPSGSGKTTLINILGGLDSPTSGRVAIGGAELATLNEAALTRYRAENVGFVFQQFHLVPYLTAVENVMLAQYFHSITDEAEAAAALQRVGLGDRLNHRPSQLSGGEQQRVTIARALINHPKILLADEPTGNLDESNQRIVLDLIRDLHAAGQTILLVTHDPGIGRLAGRRIELTHGRLAETTALSAEEGVRFDHLLEEIFMCGERGSVACVEQLSGLGPLEASHLLGHLAELELIRQSDSRISLTDRGRRRACDLVRRRRLAERLFMDTFAIEDSEADSHACKFEHIISPELDEKICTFLGHPRTCPHGHPIPPGPCCLAHQPVSTRGLTKLSP